MEVLVNKQNQMVLQPSFSMMTLILNEQQTNTFIHLAKDEHIRDGIIIPGKGTINSSVLNFLGLKNQKRMVIDVLVEKEKVAKILDIVTEKLKLNEPNHGIVYTTSVSAPACFSAQEESETYAEHREEENMFKKLTVIVNRGMADDVMDIARKAGVTGGTILHGRGTGSECAAKLFGIEIEPEKELLMMIVPNDLTEKVVHDLFEELQLCVPGNGILFTEPVWDVRGLFQGDKK